MRYVILKQLPDLELVAGCWPIASIEQVALWVVESTDLLAAERFAAERFPGRPHVVVSLPEAESIVRQQLKQRKHHQKYVAGGAA